MVFNFYNFNDTNVTRLIEIISDITYQIKIAGQHTLKYVVADILLSRL